MSLADVGTPTSLAEAVSVGLFTCQDGRITWANDALADLVGARAGTELIGSSPGSFVADGGRGMPDWPGCELNRSVGTPLECELVRLDGQGRRVRVRPLGCGAFEVHEGGGMSLPESPLPRTDPAEVDALRREVARLREERGRLERERAELFSAASHELQTPIVVISGFLRLLLSERHGDLSDEQRRYLRQAERASGRLGKLVDDLLSVHPEGSAGEGAIQAQPGDLASLLTEIAADFEAIALSQGQPLRLDLAPEAGEAGFDAMALGRVVTNLLANAFSHGRGESVTLSSRRTPDAIEIAVEDRGPGVPVAERERIFEPYVRGAAATPGKGIGLGLAICRRIVWRHGGDLELRPGAQGGSRFVIRLPLIPPAASQGSTRAAGSTR
ncbi:MAG: HAMP domain-containing sensor histidine kinase [Myxococcota bacterium]|nr:HAMP domain-containing sensor histidine kinase [Myxococcota bacterium]